MGNSDAAGQADTLVSLLARIQDSATILQQNNHAANEALRAVKKAREEELQVKENTARLTAAADAHWRKISAEAEDVKKSTQAMREQAQREYDAHVSSGVARGKAEYDTWREKVKAAEAEHSAKQAEIVKIDEDLAKRRVLMDEVKREMRSLSERLKV